MFCAPKKHHSNIDINHNELQHHFEVNILKLCEKCQCPLSFPRFAAIAAGGLDFEEGKALFWHWKVPIFKKNEPAFSENNMV